MVDYRDFWVFDESFRDSLLHYSLGLEGRTALNYWLWFGLALISVRLGLALLHDRRDVGRSITSSLRFWSPMRSQLYPPSNRTFWAQCSTGYSLWRWR